MTHAQSGPPADADLSSGHHGRVGRGTRVREIEMLRSMPEVGDALIITAGERAPDAKRTRNGKPTLPRDHEVDDVVYVEDDLAAPISSGLLPQGRHGRDPCRIPDRCPA